MKRRTFDKIVTFVGFGLAVFLLVAAGLLNWGGSFANSAVESQLKPQNIFFPEAGSPGFTAEEMPDLQKWGGQQVLTGEMARDYADKYIWVHMQGASQAALGSVKAYSEVSGMYIAALKSGTATEDEIKKLGDLRQTLFMGNTLRGTLLTAYAFWQLGQIAAIAALVALIGGVVMLLLSLAGLLHIRRTPEEAMI